MTGATGSITRDDALRARPVRVLAGVAIAAVAVPTLWITLVRDDVSMGDMALIELRVRDMLSPRASALGAYSRYGWDHPGAIWFAIAALPYRLFGGTADALRIVAIGF